MASSSLDISIDGLWTYITLVAEQALSPIGALLKIGNPTGEWWEYAVRALIAVPLVTGSLALRNYVKQER